MRAADENSLKTVSRGCCDGKRDMSLVLDSSVTLARVWSDETTDAVKHVFESLRDNGAWVPSLWRLEVSNVLEIDVRRGRIPRNSATAHWPIWRCFRFRSILKPTGMLGAQPLVWPNATV